MTDGSPPGDTAGASLHVVAVTGRFSRTDGGAADAEAVARALLDHESVSTVRVPGGTRPAVFRVDVTADAADATRDPAAAIGATVAAELELDWELLETAPVLDAGRSVRPPA